MNDPKPQKTNRVYAEDSNEYKFIDSAIRAGVPIGKLEIVAVIAKLTNKSLDEVQSIWMDAHVGIQQVIRDLPREALG